MTFKLMLPDIKLEQEIEDDFIIMGETDFLHNEWVDIYVQTIS